MTMQRYLISTGFSTLIKSLPARTLLLLYPVVHGLVVPTVEHHLARPEPAHLASKRYKGQHLAQVDSQRSFLLALPRLQNLVDPWPQTVDFFSTS